MELYVVWFLESRHMWKYFCKRMMQLVYSSIIFYAVYISQQIWLANSQGSESTCASAFPNDAAVLNYCQNGGTCNVQLVIEQPGYQQIKCTCSATFEYFWAGPDCSIRIPFRESSSSSSQASNTCWLEDLLGMNSWKNDVQVGKICQNPTCSY